MITAEALQSAHTDWRLKLSGRQHAADCSGS